jgi:hypothetical protein
MAKKAAASYFSEQILRPDARSDPRVQVHAEALGSGHLSQTLIARGGLPASVGDEEPVAAALRRLARHQPVALEPVEGLLVRARRRWMAGAPGVLLKVEANGRAVAKERA